MSYAKIFDFVIEGPVKSVEAPIINLLLLQMLVATETFFGPLVFWLESAKDEVLLLVRRRRSWPLLNLAKQKINDSRINV